MRYRSCGVLVAFLGHISAAAASVLLASFAVSAPVKTPPALDVAIVTSEEWAALAQPPADINLPEPEAPQEAQVEPLEAPAQLAEIDLPPPPLAEPLELKPPEPPKPVVKPVQREEPRKTRPVQTAQPSRIPAAQAAPTGRVASSPSPSYLGSVVRRINAARFYPPEAKENGVKGRVTIAFSIRRDGSIGPVRVVGSSGSQILDSAARIIVARAAPFGPLPEDQASQINITAPIDFSIR